MLTPTGFLKTLIPTRPKLLLMHRTKCLRPTWDLVVISYLEILLRISGIFDEYFCLDLRGTIKKELTDLWNFPKYGCPHKKGNKYFFTKNSGLQNQSVIYVQDSLKGEPRVLLDPNTLSEDGTISLKSTKWSDDGSILAYGLSQSGSDWTSMKFKKIESGEDFPETLEKIKFSSIAWTHDNKGVFYSCYPHHDPSGVTGKDTGSLENMKLYYHLVGTSQDQDVLCCEFPENPKWMLSASISDCGKYLFVTASQDCKYNLLYYCDLEEQAKDGITKKFNLTPMVPEVYEADYDYVANIGPKVIIHTNKNAKNYRLVCIDLNNLNESAWEDLIAEHEKDVLEWATGVALDKLVTCYMKDVKNTMQLRKLATGEIIHNFELDIGSVTGFSGDIKHTELIYKFSSQIHPGTIYHVDLASPNLNKEVLIEPQVNNFKTEDYKLEQVIFNIARFASRNLKNLYNKCL